MSEHTLGTETSKAVIDNGSFGTREITFSTGRLARQAPAAIARTKALIHASLHNSIEAQLAAEAVAFSQCAATQDWIEGVTAFVEKRQANFQGK